MNIKYATEFAREFIKNHPEHKGEVLDYYSLMKDEISDGGSTDHEIGLFIGSCNDLLKKDNLSESGGVYKGGGGVGKMYYHIIEYGQYDNIGYQGYYDTIEEAQKQVEKLSNYFPNQTFEIFADKSRKEPPITTMAKGGGVEKANVGYLLLAEKVKGLAPKSFDAADEKLSEQIKNNNMYAKGNIIKDKYRLTQQKVLDRGEINDSYPSDDGGSNQSEELEIIFEDKTYLIIVEFGERKKAKYPNMKATPVEQFAKGSTVKGGELRRFNRHDDMDMNTLVEINDTISKLILVHGQYKELINSLFGLFDGYDYSQTEDFKNKMQELNSENPELYNRIKTIYEEKINTYNFNSQNPMVYKNGGGVGEENKEMVLNNNKQIRHHTEELHKILKKDKTEVPAWVVSKVGRATTDLSDATHYLEGSIEKAANGMKIGTGRAGKSLMVMDYKIWDKLNIESGSQLYDDKELQKRYAKEIKMGIDKLGYDQLNEKAFDYLENWNYHALNSALTYMGYYGLERLNRTLDFNKKMMGMNINNYGLDPNIFIGELENKDPNYFIGVENMKDMMESLYTYNYGEVDKNDKYLLPYQEKLGKSLFDKTYNEELKRLQEYEIESNSFTDSEGLTYNSLKKKMAEKGTNIDGNEVSENDEYELRVSPIEEEDRDSIWTYWVIDYRKKGYKKPLFSNPFKKSEADWTRLVPIEKKFGISISIGEYQEYVEGVSIYDDKEKITKKLSEKYGIIEMKDASVLWDISLLNSQQVEYQLIIDNKYRRKELAESIAKLLSANNDKFLKLTIKTKQEMLEKQKEKIILQKNYIKPSYFVDGGGVSKYKKGGPVKDYTGTDFSKLIDDLKVFLIKYPYIWKKDGKSYVPIEGWQFAAALMGYTTRVVSVNEIENGYMAMAEVIDQDGKVVGSGFGLVTKDEAKWANSQKYELASFSQTRAVSRALRNCISWVIKAAGYKTTPAEEMYGVGSSKMQNMPKYNAPATPKTIVQYPSMTPMTPPMTTEAPMPDAFEEMMGTKDWKPFLDDMTDMLRPQKSPMAKNPDFKYKDILRDLYSQAVAYSIVLISPKFMSDVEESLLVDDNDLHYTMLERAYLYLLDNNIVLKTTRYMTKLRKIVSGENFAYGGLLKELPIEIYNAIVESGHQDDIISFDIEPFNSDGDRDKTINVEGVDYYISTKINSEEIANDLNNNTSLNHNYYIADIGGNELLISNL